MPNTIEELLARAIAQSQEGTPVFVAQGDEQASNFDASDTRGSFSRNNHPSIGELLAGNIRKKRLAEENALANRELDIRERGVDLQNVELLAQILPGQIGSEAVDTENRMRSLLGVPLAQAPEPVVSKGSNTGRSLLDRILLSSLAVAQRGPFRALGPAGIAAVERSNTPVLENKEAFREFAKQKRVDTNNPKALIAFFKDKFDLDLSEFF